MPRLWPISCITWQSIPWFQLSDDVSAQNATFSLQIMATIVL